MISGLLLGRSGKLPGKCGEHLGNLWIALRIHSDQDHGKGGLSLRGVAFMTVLMVLAVLESTLPSFCLSYKIQHNEATVSVLAVSAVMAVSVMTASPLNSTPLFRDLEVREILGMSPESFFRIILAPIKKNRHLIGTCPPPPPPKRPSPKKRGFLWAWRFSCRKRAIFPGAHKIGAAISGPRIAGKNFYGDEDFLTFGEVWRNSGKSRGSPGWGQSVSALVLLLAA